MKFNTKPSSCQSLPSTRSSLSFQDTLLLIKNPLADNSLNNNIVAYILSGTDKDCLLNDDARWFHDNAIDTLREAVISLFSVYEEEFVVSSNANWGAVILLLWLSPSNSSINKWEQFVDQVNCGKHSRKQQTVAILSPTWLFKSSLIKYSLPHLHQEHQPMSSMRTSTRV
jgi:hypothetical protein